MSEKNDFLKTLKDYTDQQRWVARIFEQVAKQRVEGRRVWPHLLLFRLYTMSHSLLTLCAIEAKNQSEVCVLDIASVGAVARALLETFVLFFHVSDPEVSEDQWAVFELHDTTARYRLLKAIGNKHSEEARDLLNRREALQKSISSSSTIKSLDPKRQEKILSGGELYISGLRDAVRKAGIDRDHFDAMYNLLSSIAHSQPSGMHRTKDGFGPTVTSDHSYLSADVIFEYATKVLDLACKRAFEIYPEVFLKNVPRH
jgi:hypothetical protein